MLSDAVWPAALGGKLTPLSDDDSRLMAKALEFPEISRSSTLLRRTGYSASAYLPTAVHRSLTNAAKLVRRARTSGARSRVPPAPLARLQAGERPWAGRRAAVLLTHDVDTAHCVAALDETLRAETDRDLGSVVNVLTHGPYVSSADWFAEIRGRGAEIGLHGSTHDYAIGGRRDHQIEQHLSTAFEVLGDERPVFYRAPAFSISRRLAQQVAAAGFRCDSSRTVYHPGFPSTRSLLPFRPLEGAEGFWELPVAIEDSLLFREWRMSPRDAEDYCDRVLSNTIDSGGVLVLDTHPGILARYPGFYPALLDRWLQRDDIWVAGGTDLLDRIEELCAE